MFFLLLLQFTRVERRMKEKSVKSFILFCFQSFSFNLLQTKTFVASFFLLLPFCCCGCCLFCLFKRNENYQNTVRTTRNRCVSSSSSFSSRQLLSRQFVDVGLLQFVREKKKKKKIENIIHFSSLRYVIFAKFKKKEREKNSLLFSNEIF